MGLSWGPLIALTLTAALGGFWLGLRLRRPKAASRPKVQDEKDLGTLRAVLVGTTEPAILANPEGQIHLVNPAAEILFGSLGDDLAGAQIDSLFPDLCDAQSCAAVAAQIASAGDAETAPAVRETRALHGPDHAFPVRLWLRGLSLDGNRYLLITVHDLTEQEQQCQELTYLRTHDPLTGLLNRHEFRARLAAMSEHPRAEEATGSPEKRVLCYLDIDRFTLINNTCGPAAGDKLLQQVAQLIESKLVPAELTARLSADQFAVLLRAPGIDAVIDLCEGLMQTVRGFLFTWQDRSFDLAMCIGIAPWDPTGQPPDDTLGRADAACHLAKRSGCNRIHVYREGEADLLRLRSDMHLVSTINHALSDGSFNLFAQPIVPIAEDHTGERHFEVLVRMVNRTGDLVAPSRFIPAAEHYILMPMVDRWIINRLFALQADNLRTWHQTNPNQFLFAVNLSGTTVTDDGFLRYLKRQFEDWQVPYPSICFEITETAAMGSLEQARTFIHEISVLGCRFALDDFGTGLSSYAYLRSLGVHYLKIDGSFVRGIATDPVNRAMVQSINHVGHVLGLETIAEWAEDEATLDVLRDLGVDYAQGFAVGRTQPVSNFTLAQVDTACQPERRACDRAPRPA